MYKRLYGGFYKVGVRFLGVLIARSLPFGVYFRAAEFWKLPYSIEGPF